MDPHPVIVTIAKTSLPAAIADRAHVAWYWYYDFIEARLISRGEAQG